MLALPLGGDGLSSDEPGSVQHLFGVAAALEGFLRVDVVLRLGEEVLPCSAWANAADGVAVLRGVRVCCVAGAGAGAGAARG